jgi:hypothetical protein
MLCSDLLQKWQIWKVLKELEADDSPIIGFLPRQWYKLMMVAMCLLPPNYVT